MWSALCIAFLILLGIAIGLLLSWLISTLTGEAPDDPELVARLDRIDERLGLMADCQNEIASFLGVECCTDGSGSDGQGSCASTWLDASTTALMTPAGLPRFDGSQIERLVHIGEPEKDVLGHQNVTTIFELLNLPRNVLSRILERVWAGADGVPPGDLDKRVDEIREQANLIIHNAHEELKNFIAQHPDNVGPIAAPVPMPSPPSPPMQDE